MAPEKTCENCKYSDLHTSHYAWCKKGLGMVEMQCGCDLWKLDRQRSDVLREKWHYGK